MDALNSLPEHQKAEFMQTLEERQLQDSFRLYNRVVEACFSECVGSFRSKKLDDKEGNCISKCAEKFLKHSQRVGERFAEAQAAMAQEMQS